MMKVSGMRLFIPSMIASAKAVKPLNLFINCQQINPFWYFCVMNTNRIV